MCKPRLPATVLSRRRRSQRVRRARRARSEGAMRSEYAPKRAAVKCAVCASSRCARAVESARRGPALGPLPPAGRPRSPLAVPTKAYVCRQKAGSDGARSAKKGARCTIMILDLTGRAASSMYRELSVGPSCELRSRRVMGGRCASRRCRGRAAAERLFPARRRALPQRHQQTLKPPAPAR